MIAFSSCPYIVRKLLYFQRRFLTCHFERHLTGGKNYNLIFVILPLAARLTLMAHIISWNPICRSLWLWDTEELFIFCESHPLYIHPCNVSTRMSIMREDDNNFSLTYHHTQQCSINKFFLPSAARTTFPSKYNQYP